MFRTRQRAAPCGPAGSFVVSGGEEIGNFPPMISKRGKRRAGFLPARRARGIRQEGRLRDSNCRSLSTVHRLTRGGDRLTRGYRLTRAGERNAPQGSGLPPEECRLRREAAVSAGISLSEKIGSGIQRPTSAAPLRLPSMSRPPCCGNDGDAVMRRHRFFFDVSA